MTATIGGLKTRVLIAHGEHGTPVEVGTLTIPLHATTTGAGVKSVGIRGYRRRLALYFVRVAWHIWRGRA